MEQFDSLLALIKQWIWGPPLLILLLGTGVYLTFILKGLQFRYLGYAIKQVFVPKWEQADGDISHFEALMTTLAGAIGTGAIVGVATAISVGGLGAIFWMWVTALLGMATKYAESLLAVKYRVMDKRGEMIGGPMEYIERGLGWNRVALLVAALGVLAAIGVGNLVQVNAISESVEVMWSVSPWLSGVVLALVVGLVLVGGVKSIGHVAGVVVPFMAIFYIIGGLAILAMHIDLIPGALYMIVANAFQGQAAAGGFMGATVMMAIQMGVARSVFSNEAGLGIPSIAAAAAKTDSPGRQAMVTMTGALLSTLIICTMTALVLAVTGVIGQTNESGCVITGACMAIEAFRSSLFGGAYVVTIGLVMFAFTTVIAWAYYGEKCFEYLFGEKSVILFRILYTCIVIPGAAIPIDSAWHFADIANGLIVIPNLIAIIALSKVVLSETESFIKRIKEEEAR